MATTPNNSGVRTPDVAAASTDPSAPPAPPPVIGWYDTDLFNYGANLPPASDLLELTVDQWNGRVVNLNGWAVSNGELVSYTPPVA